MALTKAKQGWYKRSIGACSKLSKSEIYMRFNLRHKCKHLIDHDFLYIWWLLKEPFVLCQEVMSNRQSRTKCGLVSSERTPHPWLSQSFSWRARCMSQHHGSRSPRPDMLIITRVFELWQLDERYQFLYRKIRPPRKQNESKGCYWLSQIRYNYHCNINKY